MDHIGHVEHVTLGAVQLDVGLGQPDHIGRDAGLKRRGQAWDQVGARGRHEGGLVILEAGHLAEFVELRLDDIVGGRREGRQVPVNQLLVAHGARPLGREDGDAGERADRGALEELTSSHSAQRTARPWLSNSDQR